MEDTSKLLLRAMLARPMPADLKASLERLSEEGSADSVFGSISAYGVDGYLSKAAYQLTIDEKPRLIKVSYLISDPASPIIRANFVSLRSGLADICSELARLQRADLELAEQPPGTWDAIQLEFRIAQEAYASFPQWVGRSYGGPSTEEFHLFFEGPNLKGIVPVWCDPAARGFGDWRW